MAEFIPIRTVQDKLDSISIVNGQVIFVVDTKKIFIDIDEKTRKEIGGIEGVDFQINSEGEFYFTEEQKARRNNKNLLSSYYCAF